jgi:hypothetical protein
MKHTLSIILIYTVKDWFMFFLEYLSHEKLVCCHDGGGRRRERKPKVYASYAVSK